MTSDDQPAAEPSSAEPPFQFSLRQLLAAPLLLALLLGLIAWQGFLGAGLFMWLAGLAYALFVPVPKDVSFPFRRRYLLAVPILIGLLVLDGAVPGILGPVWYAITAATAGILIITGLLLRSTHWFCAGLGIITLLLVPAVSAAREAARRVQCNCHLKQIGFALHNYHDVYKCFPPAYVTDDDGRPLYSWRVLILPFMDSRPLAAGFNLDEPWDSPNNVRELQRRACMFQCPSDKHMDFAGEPTTTSYLAVVGPDTVWPAPESASFQDIPDGLANTILVVEVHNSGVHWSEPRDLHVVQMATTINPKAGQGISSAHRDGVNVLLADGSVRFLRADSIPPELLRALLTIAGGEEVDLY